jgi:hypothetical protein
MITLEKCAAILNCNGNNYTVVEIRHVRDFLYNLANLDEFIREQNDSRKNSSDLHSS